MLKKLACIGLSAMIVLTLSGCNEDNEIKEYSKDSDIEIFNENVKDTVTNGMYTIDRANKNIIKVDLDKIDNWDVVLPSEVNGIEINSLFSDDFEGCDKITSLTIPSNYMLIGSFKNCKNLKRVIVEGGHFQTLGEETFKGCENLEEVVLKQDIEIGWNTFEGCKKLKTVSGLGRIKSIGPQAFKDCEKLVSFNVEVVDNSSIGYEAFYNCLNFDKNTLPLNLRYGDNVFGSDDNTYVIGDSNIKKIDDMYAPLSKWDNINNFEYSSKDLEIAKNEIYARHGHDFDNKGLEEYFESQKWYKRVEGKKVTYDELSDIEKYNIDLLVKYIDFTKEMEEGNGSCMWLEDAGIHIAFLANRRPKGEKVKLKYEYIENSQLKEGEIKLGGSYSPLREIAYNAGSIETELKNLLDKNITFSYFIDDKLYNKKTIYIDKMVADTPLYNNQSLLIKSDNSFEVNLAATGERYKTFDENGKELKLFDVTTGRFPVDSSFFGNKFIADDGYLYSIGTINGKVAYCKKEGEKKIKSYDVKIDSEYFEEHDVRVYDISVTYNYEDGTSSTENVESY